jgi:hypothetical protein
MNLLTDSDAARQAARSWSGRLGNLAAELPLIRPEAAVTKLDTTPPSALPARLSAILLHLRQRHQRQEHAADKLRAQEFVMGP